MRQSAVVTGVPVSSQGASHVVAGVPSRTTARIGGVDAFNDTQMARAIAESQRAAQSSQHQTHPQQIRPPQASGEESFEEQMRRAIEESQRAQPAQPVTAAPHPPAPRAVDSFDEQMRRAMEESQKTTLNDFERRAQTLKVPSEPADGEAGSAWLFFRIGEVTIKRRFWSDNSMNDVYNYLQCSRATFEAFGADEVQVVNMTTYPPSIIDFKRDGGRTLQAHELWPSGRLAVQSQGDDPESALPPAPDPAYLN